MTQFRDIDLVLGTHNTKKLVEISPVILPHVRSLSTAADFNLPEPVEDGATFEDNARIKALYVAKATGHIALADDSGLSTPKLNGFPGVNTKEFNAEYGNPRAAYAELYRRTGGETPVIATCVFVLAWPDGRTHVMRHDVDGILVHPVRGDEGFGFDPYFYYPPEGRTFGEMSREEKGLHSHRGGATRKLVAYLAGTPAP